MASRVNTRFVILLIVGVLGLLGLTLAAYMVAFKSAADNVSEGDRLLAEGNVKLAERAYSKAVNKDSTNVEYINKWIESLEMLVPETETEYRERFYGDFIGAISKKATVLRDDVDAHERQLQLTFDQLMNGYSRGLADRLIEQTTQVLGYFSGGMGEEVEEWERLKRFRGIAISMIAQNSGVIEDNKIELGIDDLERVSRVAPADTEALAALMSLYYNKTDRAAPAGRPGPRVQSLRENLERTNEYLSQYPDSARMRIQRVMLRADIARRTLDRSLEPTEQLEQLKLEYGRFSDELDSIAQGLTGENSDQLDLRVAIVFGGIENAVDPESRFSRSRRLLDHLIENDRDNAEIMYYAGQLAQRAGDTEEADAWYEQIGSLETKPLSYEGFRQFPIQRQAMVDRCEIKLDIAETALTDDERDEALARAKTMRDEFSSVVSDDNLALMMLNGRIARVEKQYDEALRIFKRYNEQTQQNEADGLWYEGIIASQLGQYGVARDALEQLILFENSPRRILALLTLAQIHDELQELDTAADYYKQVMELRPDMQVAADAYDRINRRLNPELNEDPALAAIYTSRQMRTGDEDNPGDYAGAIQYLREQVQELNYESRVSRELASLLLDRGDIEGSKVLITRAVENNPDDEGLQRMLGALDAGDTTEILVQLLRDSPGPLLDRLVSIANIASTRGRAELLSETVAELNELAPGDKRVLELTFVDALRRGDTETARRIAQHQDNTRVESLMYQSRIAISEQQSERAMDLLNQAAATGAADASVYQMLAILQRDAGRMTESLASFNQALAIRPDNSDVIREYLITLTQARQYDQALNEARRYQRYATGDPVFLNLWLSLEAQFGAQQGREFATRQRERMLELNPNDTDNAYQLARLYILDRNWDDARALIDTLRSSGDRLEYVELDATWYAEQGVVNGREGLVQANEVFTNYIASLPEPVGPEPYVVSSQFMLSRGRPDLALAAANKAVERQSPDSMIGSILLGDLHMRINNQSEAVKAYREVIDAGADDENQTVRARLIESLVRLERYDEAQEMYDGFRPEKSDEMITMLQGADIAAGREDNARAQELLDNAVSAFPNDPLVYIKRAELMVGDESLRDDMLSDLNRALELDPSNWRAYRVRAAGYFALGQREEALNDLKETVRLNPSLDRSVYSVLNELLSQPGRSGEAADVAREVLAVRSDDANLMARIGGLFASRSEWEYASEFYEMAWNKRRSPADGATLIDTLVRQTPPDSSKANNVINQLAAIVGDLNENSGLLAAQALVLQARGREDFAQQQITKAFDLSVSDNSELLNWGNNLSRYFEGRPTREHVAYLEALKRRNSNPVIGQWLDYFIVQRQIREDDVPQSAYQTIETLKSESTPNPIAVRVYRLHATNLYAQDDFEGAVDVWKAGLARFPQDWEMNNNIAYTLGTKLGKPEEALGYAEKSISENIGLSEPYETIASIYIALGKYDEAEQMIATGSNFINSVPSRVTMQLTAGRLALKRGDLAEARSKLTDSRSVLRAAPESYPSIETDIDEFEQELNSADN